MPRTVTFKSVLNSVLTLMGLDPDVAADAATKAAVGVYINDRVREAWEYHDWPETRALEERAYRRAWSAGIAATIAQDEIVYHAKAYWRAKVAGTSQEPGEGATAWEVATIFEKYIELEQDGKTAISEVLGVYDQNPRLYGNAKKIPFQLTEHGAQVGVNAPATVWVKFSQRAAVFAARAWGQVTPYDAGDVVMQGGECYRARRTNQGVMPSRTATADWEWQPLLHVLSRYVIRAAYADALTEDGQVTKADWQLLQAKGALDDELAKLALKQGQVAEIAVATN